MEDLSHVLWIGGPAAAGKSTVSQTLAAVEKHFATALAAGPAAGSVRERQDLLRYANEVAVTHNLTKIARGFVSGDASTVIQTFDCECAAPACDALVELSVGEAAAALADPPPALLAPGHQAPVQ